MSDSRTKPSSSPSSFTRTRARLFLIATLCFGAALTALMTWWVIGSPPRTQAVAVAAGASLAEYAILPDDDAYPAAIALGADGTVYTGSYQSGTVWAVVDGVPRELAQSRARIGSVSGLDTAPDGSLLILDRITPLDAQGAVIWRYAAGELRPLVQIPQDETSGLTLPDDIAVDGRGYIYVSDRAPARVWRYAADGRSQALWWQPTAVDAAPTGLAYDPAHDAILITDSAKDAIYRVPVAAVELSAARRQTETVYQDGSGAGYGFDGIAVSPGGEVYVALLAWNRVARLERGGLVMLARDFRGASDLAYDGQEARLFITNWNQFSLGFGTRPQLPFALDVLHLPSEAAQ